SETAYLDEGAGRTRVEANESYQNLESSNWNSGLGDSMARPAPGTTVAWHSCEGGRPEGCMYPDPGVEYTQDASATEYQDPAEICHGDPVCIQGIDRQIRA